MANSSPLKETNQFVAHKSTEVTEYIETVVGFLVVSGYFYYDNYTAMKIFMGASIFILLAVIISF